MIDLNRFSVVAACALTQDAALWTLNSQDFRPIPDLDLV